MALKALLGLLAAVVSVRCAPTDHSARQARPNIIFILTDDQDMKMNSLDYMPFVQKHLIDEGTLFTHHYCPSALCCPARVTLWTGSNPHNTNVTTLNPPYGGYPKFVKEGLNDAWLPLWLKDAGYQTYYVGKLFNAFNEETYNSPCPKGWTGSEFLVEPWTYSYQNPASSRNCGPVVPYNGTYNTDLVADQSFGFLDDAIEDGSPFFLTIAPMAPHSQVVTSPGESTKPVPKEKYADWFPDAKVPRKDNFNPDVPSGASWIKELPKLTPEQVDQGDHYYRLRLRTLQSIDEMVDDLFQRLEREGLLDNTYIFYSSDNGFHISQHRLVTGKNCGYEEDTNVPLIVRGPNIPKGVTKRAVSSHVDLVPTFFDIAGIPLRDDFDGTPLPLTKDSDQGQREVAAIEFWTLWAPPSQGVGKVNNVYKAVRLVGEGYNLYYAVWCTNEHELYDMTKDPGQMVNLLESGFNNKDAKRSTDLGVTDQQLASRLDGLLFLMKSCKGETCRNPWGTLMPGAGVSSLIDSLGEKHNNFFEETLPRVGFTSCEPGYIIAAEGPQYNRWVNKQERFDDAVSLGLVSPQSVRIGGDMEWSTGR